MARIVLDKSPGRNPFNHRLRNFYYEFASI